MIHYPARVPSFLRTLSFGTKWGIVEERSEDVDEGEDDADGATAAAASPWNTTDIWEKVSEQEPFDADSLFESMHARRTASERELAGLGGTSLGPSLGLRQTSSDSLGILFSPTD